MPDALLALRDLSKSNKAILDLLLWKSQTAITCHCSNLDRSSWKSWPFNMKILTVHHENLDRSVWNLNRLLGKSQPFNMKSWLFKIKIWSIHHEISTVQQKNLDHSTWSLDHPVGKSWPFIIKSWQFKMKILTIQHEISTVQHEISTFGWSGFPYVRTASSVIMKALYEWMKSLVSGQHICFKDLLF